MAEKKVEKERPVALNFENQYLANAQQVKNPSVRSFLLIEDGDLAVVTEPRINRTTISTVPMVEQSREQSNHVQDSFHVFDKNYTTVIYKNRENGGGTQISFAPPISLPPQIYEVDLAEMPEFNVVSQKLDETLLEAMNNDSVVNNILQQDSALRQVDRFPLYSLLKPTKVFEATDPRSLGEKTFSSNDLEYIVGLRDFSTALGNYEPFFAAMALYDLKAKRRLSENYFTAYNTQFLPKLHGRPAPPGSANTGNTAKFRISSPSSDIYLVIRLEKVLMGDETTVATYFKNNMKPKEIQKLTAFIESNFQRIGAYTQSFGLAVIPLFKETGDPLYNGLKKITVEKFVRMNGDLSDDNLYKNLKTLLSDKDPIKLKVIPCHISGEIGVVNIKLSNQLTPSLIPIAPQDEKVQGINVVREIQEFYLDDTGLFPHFEYVHNLYVYPLQLNMNNWNGKGNARNLSIDVYFKDNDEVSLNGMMKVFGRSFEPDYLGKYITSVFYHDVKPTFYDEIKISLPAKVTNKHHLLFVINHINVRPKDKKEKQESCSTAVAFAFLPLIKGDSIISSADHALSIVYSLVPGYLSPDSQYSMKHIEKNQKPNFFLRTQLVSSIDSSDETLNAFFREYDANIDKSSFQTAISNLKIISPSLSIKWFPSLITSLTRIIMNQSPHTGMRAFQSMMFIVDSVSRTTGKPISDQHPQIQHYANYLFDVTKGNSLFHESFLSAWVATLEEKNAEFCEVTSRHCWFPFTLLVKSMVLYLQAVDMLNESVRRQARFTQEFCGKIAKLIALTLDEVHSRNTLSRIINESLAHFVKDLLTLLDRGILMDLIYLYVTKVPPTLKYEFLRIICDYENFVQLSLPLPDRVDEIPNLENNLWSKHFLVGVLADEITNDILKQQWGVAMQAIETLYFLLLKHEVDPRYQTPVTRTCIAGMYFIFILKLTNIFESDKRCILEAPIEIQKRIMGCFLWIIKNMPRKLLQQWWNLETQKRIINFFLLMGNCLGVFEYCKDDSSADNIDLLQPQHRKNLGIDTLSDDPLQAYRQSTLVSTPKRLAQKSSDNLTEQEVYDKTRDQNLNREVSIICLDILMNFVNDYTIELRKPGSIFMERIVVNILFIMLKKRQCESFMTCLFSAIRMIVWIFPIPLFQDINPYCGDLTYGVLRNCASLNQSVRSKASAIFYLFTKNNFLLLGNFSRMKLQATIAVSKLVGEGIAQDSAAFKDSLLAVSKYAQADKDMPNSFKTQATELTQRLFTVLKNSIKIAEFSYDHEMTADLYYSISKGYIASPDLRAAWLQSLAQFHIECGNLEEAAQCKIHLASLISVYINHLKPTERVVVNPIQFQRAAPNSYAEMNIPKEAFEEEGICQSNTFTRQGLFSQLAEAVTFLKKISLFESCISVNRLVINILRENRNFQDLSKVFEDSAQLCTDIEASNQSNSRMFANHYLVGFYGKDFKEIDGVEFIYREGQHVRLADISSKLKERYTKKFGKCTIVSRIDKAALNPEEPTIRMLSVKPFFTKEELQSKDRQSPFERQFNIQRFIYETPFTTTGKAYSDDMTEQQKKKTILEIELSFPYVIKRLAVVKQWETILSPIQSSIELIEERCQSLNTELVAIPPNSKTLQIILQGSVLLQVNAGPLAIARTFLGNYSVYPKEDVLRLLECLKLFVSLCGDGIRLNKSLIGSDQVTFHEQMVKGYEDLHREVSSIIAGVNI